jgi:gas vesicle protein
MNVGGGDKTMTSGGRTLTYVGIALVGGVAGALVGLLTAPARGIETRRRLGDGADAVVRSGHYALEGVADYLQETTRELSRAVIG